MYYYVLRDLSVYFDLSSGKEFTHDFTACMYLTNENFAVETFDVKIFVQAVQVVRSATAHCVRKM